VIGLIGTAPDADAAKFPLNTPVLVASRSEMAGLGEAGTLQAALDLIYDQAGAVVVVVRVAEGVDETATINNVRGGINNTTGAYEGVHAFLAAENEVGFSPRLLVAPGFTHQRTSNGILSIAVQTQGSGYTTAPAVTISGGGGSGATAVAVLGTGANAGKVVSFTITNPGKGYTTNPTVTIAAPPSGVQAVAGTINRGTVRSEVLAELLGIANRLRAHIIADGANTTDAAAIQMAGDFGSRRIYVVDPWVLRDGSSVPASAGVAGLINKVDNERGFWWSPSNNEINGIEGTARAIDFTLGDYTSRANLLNEAKIATIIRSQGFRLWGNRTLASDPKYAFLSISRTADMVDESILRGHQWAVDRCITATYLEEVQESVRGYLRSLKARGAILGGDVWVDPDLNTPANIANGQVFFDYDFTGPYPAERVTFRSHLVDSYVVNLFA
jgi:phage tail sheath protein FI